MPKPFKIVHTADLHISAKEEKLGEVMRVADELFRKAAYIEPDLIIIAGDTVDEYDGPIRADSKAFRYLVSIIQNLAQIAPVAIVLGTPSHDRHTPELLRELDTRYQVYVGTKFEMVGLYVRENDEIYFGAYPSKVGNMLKAVLTFLPSPDKARIVAMSDGTSKQLVNLQAKECLHDALHYLGELNHGINVPRILIGHGMITGAEYSTGAVSTGEDLEYSYSDLNATNTDYKAFGHIHKFQTFPGNIVYSGSPGRLNYGEKEEKGFVTVTFETGAGEDGLGWKKVDIKFIPLPAREFCFAEVEWQGIDHLKAELAACAAVCAGRDTRFRYEIPEEERHLITRTEITDALAAAREVKVECTILPKVRQRAAGISRLLTLSDKIRKWAETTGTEVPERVYVITDTIEGNDVGELLDSARAKIGGTA